MNNDTKEPYKAVVVFVDLDNFEYCTKLKNWDPYQPNPITSFLTKSLEKLISKYHAVNLWGINKSRGTEEAILIFYKNINNIVDIIENLKKQIKELAKFHEVPTSLSVGIAQGFISNIKKINSHSRKEFKKDPTIFLAYKALKKAKSAGGNTIVIL